MAKIPVEKKSGGGGWWKWLLGLLLLALIIWILVELFDTDEEADVAVGEADVEAVEPIETPEPMDGDEVMDIGAILSNPDEQIGETFPDMEVTVASVPTDRGFWITQGNDSLMAIIIDVPAEQPKDVNPGATLMVEDGTLRAPSYLPEMPGNPLDQTTENLARQQEVLLVVDERYIEVLEQGNPQPGTDPARAVQ